MAFLPNMLIQSPQKMGVGNPGLLCGLYQETFASLHQLEIWAAGHVDITVYADLTQTQGQFVNAFLAFLLQIKIIRCGAASKIECKVVIN